jgi:hypothetical protein
MTECCCLQFLDLDWTTFYSASLVVMAVLDVDLGTVVLAVVPAVVPGGVGDGVGDGVVPAMDLEDLEHLVEAGVDLIRVMVAVAVDMEDIIRGSEILVMVLQATEVMEVQLTMVNTGIMVD